MQSIEIRECDRCSKGLCVAGHVTFVRLLFERFEVDQGARHSERTINAFYAGQDIPAFVDQGPKAPEAAVLLDEPADLIVCETCAATPGETLATLGQLAQVSLAERKAAVGNIDKGDQDDDSSNQD